MTYEQLQARIASWAAAQPDIRAVIIVGSQATGRADQWSDLDLVMLTNERARYLDPGWLHSFGAAWLMYLDEAGPDDPEWFALYEGGLKVDFVLLQVDADIPDLELLLQRYPYQTVFARGIKVLFDQHGDPRSLPSKAIDLPSPSVSAFDHLVGGFLLEAVTTAKFIARGDFWRAQHWFSYDLRPHLLKLAEWHAYGRDTWYNGRFINSWADPRVLAALPRIFALYQRENLSMALQTLLELFQVLGEETATRFHFNYPVEAHRKATALVNSILRV